MKALFYLLLFSSLSVFADEPLKSLNSNCTALLKRAARPHPAFFSLSEVEKDIYVLTFKNPREMAYTFLRFQEYYESPEFQGEIFTIKQYRRWYVGQSKTKNFSYYKDWGGFNMTPSPKTSPGRV